jgi:OmpR family response regulator RpaB|tara:strand:- start:14984 stop:15697 length:714 start_codon:yes stop_codon:yes gene_type:complete
VIVYKKKILIVDSDPEIQLFLKQELTRLDYQIFSAFNSEDGLLLFTDERPDLIIVDVVLQKLDGYSVCQEIRKISSVPIIIVTMASHISDRLMGFEVGANDYVVKPFSKKELEVRIRALLDNSVKKQPKFTKKTSKRLQIQNLIIEIDKRLIVKNDLRIKLTDIEYDLLKLFIEHPGKELSRTMILENVWGYKSERSADTRIVDVNISRLRAKIEENPSNPNLILTIRGLGYMFHIC